MGKKKSVVLLVIISVVLAVLAVMSFASFHIPFVKEGVKKFNSFIEYADLDVDLEGGYSYTMTLNENSEEVENIDDVVKTVSGRLNALGYKNYKITLMRESENDEYSIRLDVEGKETVDTDIATVASYGEVRVKDGDTIVAYGKDVIKNAYNAGPNGSSYVVALEFTTEGYKALKAHLDENTDASLDVVLSGETDTTLLSGLNGEYLGQTVYANASSQADADRLALQIRTGGLKYEYDLSDARAIEPVLGVKASTLILIASLVIVVAVLVLFAIFAKGLGIAADLALVAQMLLQITMLYLVPNVTVSFGSVLGMLASFLLCAVMTYVFVNDIAKEFAAGKTLRAAVKASYSRYGLNALDIHVITGVFALAMFIFAGHAIQAFAITFGLGTVLSALISILFSHLTVSIIISVSNGKESFLGMKREG
ncbi:MAG: hypothetical protein MJ072_01670 [Clostridia bacterium]|nr:hypothetical protein [Clostridia bacterium]